MWRPALHLRHTEMRWRLWLKRRCRWRCSDALNKPANDSIWFWLRVWAIQSVVHSIRREANTSQPSASASYRKSNGRTSSDFKNRLAVSCKYPNQYYWAFRTSLKGDIDTPDVCSHSWPLYRIEAHRWLPWWLYYKKTNFLLFKVASIISRCTLIIDCWSERCSTSNSAFYSHSFM